MSIIGHRVPIHVMPVEGLGPLGVPGWVLVTGYHRLQAAKALGLHYIDCLSFDGDERAARRWEISENLAHAPLTALEEAEQTAEWVRLTEDEWVSGQKVQKPKGGRPEGGLSKAARELPLRGKTVGARRKRAERSISIADLSPEAKAAIKGIGLDNNPAALLEIAKEPTPEAQVEKARETAERKKKARRKKSAKAAMATSTVSAASSPPLAVNDEGLILPPSLDHKDPEALFAAMQAVWVNTGLAAAWADAPPVVRERFIAEVLHGSATANGARCS